MAREMVVLMGRMLELHEKLAEAKIERERTMVGHQISATDRQIDDPVYELHGLTSEVTLHRGYSADWTGHIQDGLFPRNSWKTFIFEQITPK